MSDVPVIAIVDDDEAMREALFDLLQVADIEARTFASASAFLADPAASGMDVLVTDVRMPGMDGLELQRRLRARGASIPLIFVTSSSDPATRQRALEQGAFAYLTKPVGDDLLQQIRAALAGR